MNVTITGFYGAGNTGDEAILSAIIKSVRGEYPDATFTVLSFDPSTTKAEHNVDSLYRPNFGRNWVKMRFREMYRTVERSDVVIVGGGGILQNVHNDMTVPRYLQTAVLAKALGTPVVYYGVGAGPIEGRVLEAQLRAVCNAGDSIIVRDEHSKHCLESIGIGETLIKVGVDPVFALEPVSDDRAENMLEREGVRTDRELFGVSVRHHELPEQAKEGIARFLDKVSEEQMEVVFIPFGKGAESSDRSVSKGIARRMESDNRVHVLSDKYQPEMILGFVEQMDFVLGMRLHSVIMAATAEVPVLGIPYHPKVRSTLHRLGYEERHFVKSPSGATEEALSNAYTSIKTESEVRENSVESSRQLKQQARQQVTALEQVVERPFGRLRSAVLLFWFGITTVLLRLTQLQSDLESDEEE